MSLLGTLTVWLTGDGSGYDRMLSNAESRTASFVSSTATALKGLASAFALGAFGQSALSRFSAAEDASHRLVSTFREQGEAYSSYGSRFEAAAAKLDKETLVSKTQVIDAMASAKAMGVQSEMLEKSAYAAAGLSAAFTKGDFAQAMRLIALASNGSTAELKRYGIAIDESLSPQQKLNQLLDVGISKYGMATAATQTWSGQLAMLDKQWGGLLSSVGAQLSEFLKPFIKIANDVLKWFNGLSGGQKAFATEVAAFVTIGGTAVSVYKAITGGLDAIASALGKTAAAMLADTAATNNNTVAHMANGNARRTSGLGSFSGSPETMGNKKYKSQFDTLGGSNALFSTYAKEQYVGSNASASWGQVSKGMDYQMPKFKAAGTVAATGFIGAFSSAIKGGASSIVSGISALGSLVLKVLPLVGWATAIWDGIKSAWNQTKDEQGLAMASGLSKVISDALSVQKGADWLVGWVTGIGNVDGKYKKLTTTIQQTSSALNDQASIEDKELSALQNAFREKMRQWEYEDATPEKKIAMLNGQIFDLNARMQAVQGTSAAANQERERHYEKIVELQREQNKLTDSLADADKKARERKAEELLSTRKSNADSARSMYLDSLDSEERMNVLEKERMGLKKQIVTSGDENEKEILTGRLLALDKELLALSKSQNAEPEKGYQLSAAMSQGSAEAYTYSLKISSQNSAARLEDYQKKTSDNTKTMVDVMKDIKESLKFEVATL